MERLLPSLKGPRGSHQPSLPPPQRRDEDRATESLTLWAGGKTAQHARPRSVSQAVRAQPPVFCTSPCTSHAATPRGSDTPQSDHPQALPRALRTRPSPAKPQAPPHPGTSPAPSCAKTRLFPAAPPVGVLSLPPIMPLGLEGAPLFKTSFPGQQNPPPSLAGYL